MLFKVRKTMMSTAVCCSVIFGASQTVCADQTELGRTVPDYLWHNGFEYYVFKTNRLTEPSMQRDIHPTKEDFVSHLNILAADSTDRLRNTPQPKTIR